MSEEVNTELNMEPGWPLGNYRCGFHDVAVSIRNGLWWCPMCDELERAAQTLPADTGEKGGLTGESLTE